MKNLKITALALFATVAMNAQDLKMTDVPSALTTSFQKTYTNVTDVEWEMEGENYKVEFEDANKMEHEIWYTKDGSIVKTEMEISKSQLPSEITKSIGSNYSGYKIDSIEMTEMGNKKTYEVELEKGWSTERTVVFDAAGKVLSDIED
ncbi:MAG: PepSY-like domain-containing protein [Aquaticitalea sp.]